MADPKVRLTVSGLGLAEVQTLVSAHFSHYQGIEPDEIIAEKGTNEKTSVGILYLKGSVKNKPALERLVQKLASEVKYALEVDSIE